MLDKPVFTQAPDRELCLTLLRHFKDMPDKLFSVHCATSFWPLQQPADCPRCIGIHAAQAIGAKIFFPSWSDHYYFDFQHGRDAIYQALGQDQAEADQTFRRHGASLQPFDYAAWPTHPFDVLKGAFEEALGETLEV